MIFKVFKNEVFFWDDNVVFFIWQCEFVYFCDCGLNLNFVFSDVNSWYIYFKFFYKDSCFFVLLVNLFFINQLLIIGYFEYNMFVRIKISYIYKILVVF